MVNFDINIVNINMNLVSIEFIYIYYNRILVSIYIQ